MNSLGRNIVLILFLSVFAGSAPAAVFVKGKVTRAPWKDAEYHIAVNNVEYTIMPKAKIMLKRNRGGHSVRTGMLDQLDDVATGMTVWISVEGNRVYQLWQEK